MSLGVSYHPLVVDPIDGDEVSGLRMRQLDRDERVF